MRLTALALALVVIGATGVDAQEPVGSFADLWMRVKSGDRISVIEASGRETTGVFATVSDATLTLLVDGALRDLPAEDVRQIARHGDSVKNGFLIGAGVGAVLGALTFADCDDDYAGCMHPAAGVLMSGLVYGGIGALIDHFIRGRTVVFRVKSTALHVRPSLSVERRTVSLSLAW